VTFNGFTDQTPGPDLISLGFSSCFGTGASARVTAPGGDPDTDKGPISAVTLTNGGSGYAKLGRVAPTLTISGGTGTGATFTPTLTSTNDACGIPTWALTSVTFKGGAGYIDGESLTITAAEGDTEVQASTAVANTTRTQPTLSASIGGGSGASFTVTTSANPGTPATWGVASVAVTNGGTGYSDGAAVTFSGSGDLVVVAESQAYILTGRSQPTLSASVTSSGTGASITPTMTQYTGYDGRPYWSATGLTIASGGTGYAENDTVEVTVSDGQASPYSYFSAYVATVDGNGAILTLVIDYGGEYWKDTGVIQSVEVWDGGSYYDDDGVPTGVTVTSGGQYYREDASEPPFVANVTVTVASQSPPSDGTGATFTATVEDDPESPDFGMITSLTIDDGGDDYLAWQWKNTKCCGDYYNGLSVVLQRSGCLYSHSLCGVGNIRGGVGRITLEYFGPSVAPVIRLLSEAGTTEVSVACNAVLVAGSNVADCGDWSGVSFSASGGITATVEAGGEYDPLFRNPGGPSCFICCKGGQEIPQELEISVVDNRPGGDMTGTYILTRGGIISGNPTSAPVNVSLGFVFSTVNNAVFRSVRVAMVACSTQNTTSFAADGDCDFCHKKCKVVAQIAFGAGGSVVYASEIQPSCDSCEDTPLCSPAGKTLTLCGAFFGGQCLMQVST
jgi:hypothetical protein